MAGMVITLFEAAIVLSRIPLRVGMFILPEGHSRPQLLLYA